MYIVVTTFERPADNIPYYIDSVPDLKPQFVEFLKHTTDWLAFLNTENETPTKQITTAVYASKEDFDKFMTEFNLGFPDFEINRDNYCESHNIVITRTVEED